jgi:flagellar biosynthesis component FlhA
MTPAAAYCLVCFAPFALLLAFSLVVWLVGFRARRRMNQQLRELEHIARLQEQELERLASRRDSRAAADEYVVVLNSGYRLVLNAQKPDDARALLGLYIGRACGRLRLQA